MQTIPFRYHQPFKAFRSLAGLLAIIALCATHSAWSQQPPYFDSPTHPPRRQHAVQVMSGTAKLVEPYDPASKLRLAINITPPKMAEEEAFLKELQDRNSPNFHKYLTPKQWNARFAPAPEDEQAVVDWANQSGTHRHRALSQSSDGRRGGHGRRDPEGLQRQHQQVRGQRRARVFQ